MPNTHGCQPSPTNAASMILSLDQKPANGGTPKIASHPIMKVTQVIFIAPLRPPKRRMSTRLFMPCMTDPAPKNMPALKKPCVTKWKMAKT